MEQHDLAVLQREIINTLMDKVAILEEMVNGQFAILAEHQERFEMICALFMAQQEINRRASR